MSECLRVSGHFIKTQNKCSGFHKISAVSQVSFIVELQRKGFAYEKWLPGPQVRESAGGGANSLEENNCNLKMMDTSEHQKQLDTPLRQGSPE